MDPERSGVGLAWGAPHAVREAAPQPLVDLGIAEAGERQTTAVRALSRWAFPEPEAVAVDTPALIGQDRARHRRPTAATGADALRRARAGRAGKDQGPRRLGQTA